MVTLTGLAVTMVVKDILSPYLKKKDLVVALDETNNTNYEAERVLRKLETLISHHGNKRAIAAFELYKDDPSIYEDSIIRLLIRYAEEDEAFRDELLEIASNVTFRSKKSPSINSTSVLASGIGGALAGASLGIPGALIGGIAGGVIGYLSTRNRDETERES